MARSWKEQVHDGGPAAALHHAASFRALCRETLRTIATPQPPVPRRFARNRENLAPPAPELVPQR